jgi:pantoate--beta-alanine ligase
LSRSLLAAADRFEAGERSSRNLVDAARAELEGDSVTATEYVEVARASDASVVDEVRALSFIALAARIGGVRLIDNVFLDPKAGRADRGTRLTRPSILYGGN